MSKYVEVSALEKAIIEYAQDLRTLSTKTVGQAISSLPTIEIVHCKDCKCWNGKYCFNGSASVPKVPKEIDFCSWGERKDNDKFDYGHQQSDERCNCTP